MSKAERDYWMRDPDLTNQALDKIADPGDKLIEARERLRQAARRWLEVNYPDQFK